jgi:hypothetical protein
LPCPAQQGPAIGQRHALRFCEQGAAHAEPARTRTDQHLGHVGAMRLVLRYRPHHLRRADDVPLFILGDDERAIVASQTFGDRAPEPGRLGVGHRPHETHRCAGFHAFHQHVAEFVERSRAEIRQLAHGDAAHEASTTM